MTHYISTVRTILITGLAFFVNFVITMALVPYITDIVSAEAYGWVKLATDIVVYCGVLVLAIQSFATRFIGVAYHRKDFEQANQYFSSAFFGDSALGLVIFFLAIIGVWKMDRFFNISPELVSDVKLLFFYTLLKFLQMTVLAVFECGPMITDRMYITGRYKLFSYLVQAGLLLLFYNVFGPNIYWVGAALLVASLVTTIPNILICIRYAPELRISPKFFSWRAVKDLVGNGIWSALISLSSLLNNGLDLMITNLMLTPLMMGQMAIVQSISVIVNSIFAMVTPAFQPMLLKSYSDNNHEQLMRRFYISMKTCSGISSIFFAGFVALGYSFYELWIPNQDYDLIYQLTVIAIIPGVTGGIIAPMYFAYTLTVKKMVPFLFSFICGCCNVIGMYVLIKYTGLGIYSVVLTTAVLMGTMQMVAHPLYISHVLEEPRREIYGNILRCLASSGGVLVLFLLLHFCFTPYSLKVLVVCAMIYTLAGSFVYVMMVLDRNEKRQLMAMLSDLRGKLRNRKEQ